MTPTALGNVAQHAISLWYLGMNAKDVGEIYFDTRINVISEALGAERDTWRSMGRGRPDIYNHATGDVYEIKTITEWGTKHTATMRQLDGYISTLARFGVAGAHRGPTATLATTGVMALKGMTLAWFSPEPGIIVYFTVPNMPPPVVKPTTRPWPILVPVRPRIPFKILNGIRFRPPPAPGYFFPILFFRSILYDLDKFGRVPTSA